MKPVFIFLFNAHIIGRLLSNRPAPESGTAFIRPSRAPSPCFLDDTRGFHHLIYILPLFLRHPFTFDLKRFFIRRWTNSLPVRSARITAVVLPGARGYMGNIAQEIDAEVVVRANPVSAQILHGIGATRTEIYRPRRSQSIVTRKYGPSAAASVAIGIAAVARRNPRHLPAPESLCPHHTDLRMGLLNLQVLLYQFNRCSATAPLDRV